MATKFGEQLAKESVIETEQIEYALRLQKEYGGRLGDILLALSSTRALEYYQALAKHYNLEFVNLLKTPIDMGLLEDADQTIYMERNCLPVRREEKHWTVATADPSAELFTFIKSRWGEQTRIVCTSKYDILHILQKRFGQTYLDDSVNSLLRKNAGFSSKYILSRWQLLFLVSLVAFAAYAYAKHPLRFLIGLNYFFMVAVTGVIFFRILLALVKSFSRYFKPPEASTELPAGRLPVYSILLPLYQEKEITLRGLFDSIEKLDYPKHLLDLKVLVEQDDRETLDILKKLKLPSYYEFIPVPEGRPRTKAKACNYGLRFVRGEYLTLYDAEDQPEPSQLRKVLEVFDQNKAERLACVQCHLNFFNSDENWLTRMFTLEYTCWFDLMLPALELLRMPIPLGGTSNHFKTHVLSELHAWDPYNVTEDADLGVRLARLGYTTRLIESTTYEEANCRLLNWFRQRTRWVKGYIQTYLVHMRNPLKLWLSLGTVGFWGFQLFVGGAILTNLVYFPLWGVFLLSSLPGDYFAFLHVGAVARLEALNCLLGTVGIIILSLAGALQRRKYRLMPATLTAPFYWLLISLASYRALYQLIFKPSLWEKTEHGISKMLNKDGVL